jgi:hypothetical protein
MGQDPPHDPMDVQEDATSAHSTSSFGEKVASLLQYPHNVAPSWSYVLEHIEVVSLLPQSVQERISCSFQATSTSP